MASLMSLSSEPRARKLHFFDLPAEIRLKIYELVLVRPSSTIDLDTLNYRIIRPRLSCFLVCRRMHHEAYHVFYGSTQQPLRLFPTSPTAGRLLYTNKPLLYRVGPRYRSAIRAIELRLGPGWSKPPRCWHTGEQHGLVDCISLRIIKIFVEIDPSGDFFDGFRGHGNTKDTYKVFCANILRGIFEQVPSIEIVEFDAFPAVSQDTSLVRTLMAEASEAGKRITWGPLRGWREESDIGGLIGLENAMAAMGI